MKKLTGLFFALTAAFMLTVPTLAATPMDEPPAGYDLLDLDGPEPSAAFHVPAQSPDAPADSPESTPTPVEDVPVDESTYHEEEPAPYTPVQRTPGRGEITDILSYWEENGYPADVSYAFEAGGEVMEDGTVCAWWEIGLVDADEARRQELLDLVSPDCLVEFKACLFTHAEKQAAYDKLTELAADDPNILEVIFIRNGDTVWVSVPEDVVKEYAEYLIRDLGLGAVVSVTDQHSIASFEGGLQIGVDTAMGLDVAAPGGDNNTITGGGLVPDATVPQAQGSPVFWVCLALAVIAACGLTVLALRRRPARLAVTAHGEIHTASAPLTRAQTEQLVRDSEETPPEELLRAIVERGRRP